MLDLISMGEAMVQFNPLTVGPLRTVHYFEKHSAGAEANVAVGLARMGFKSGFITRLGNDEFGKYLKSVLRGEGVDTSRIIVDNEAPTGIYFIQRGFPRPGRSKMIYYRRGSAASRLSPADLDMQYLKNTRVFHITGITPALSESCRKASIEAVRAAKKGGAIVSLDTNIRLNLWTREEARSTLTELLSDVDVLLVDPEDSEILVGDRDPSSAAAKFLKMGPSIVVEKLGAKGAMAAKAGERYIQPPFPVQVVDPIGAGDAFAAGFLSSLLKNYDLKHSLEIATAAGSLVVTVRGDQENIPSLEEAEEFLRGIE